MRPTCQRHLSHHNTCQRLLRQNRLFWGEKEAVGSTSAALAGNWSNHWPPPTHPVHLLGSHDMPLLVPMGHEHAYACAHPHAHIHGAGMTHHTCCHGWVTWPGWMQIGKISYEAENQTDVSLIMVVWVGLLVVLYAIFSHRHASLTHSHHQYHQLY